MFSHHITKDSYKFIPILDMSEPWTDEKLYKKYSITKDEQAFIESMIRPMEIMEAEE
jgi:site-specific DNA-methyltransferase (adenine-specific)